MKKAAFVVLLSMIFTGSFAQLGSLNKSKTAKDLERKSALAYKLKDFKPQVYLNKSSNATQMPVLKAQVSKRLLGTTNNGNEVYAIDPYNMPCISPSKNYKSNMPVLAVKPVEAIKPSEE